MASDDEDDYIFFGTPIQEEEESRAGQRRKDVKDPALTKQLPLHKQVQHHSLQHL
jgi:G patch domain-containing protein 1